MAVVAMVEPETAENTVPATTATTASRPGTWRISRSTPSMTLMARPVWNRISPISTNSGIGVSDRFITEATLLRTTCASPASPPRNSSAPTMLTATKVSATGMPISSSAVDPPSSSSAATCHVMAALAAERRFPPPCGEGLGVGGTPTSMFCNPPHPVPPPRGGGDAYTSEENVMTKPPSRRRHRIGARRPLGAGEAVHAEHELDGQQQEGRRAAAPASTTRA